jgi:hypothetical protein
MLNNLMLMTPPDLQDVIPVAKPNLIDVKSWKLEELLTA